MEAQTDIQAYLEQGKQALAQGQGREAAIAYAHGAQIEPENPMVHLGLAEANLALGNYGVVQMACCRVQELQPAGSLESIMAQALLDLLERRYDRALQKVDSVISEDPGMAYAHALRAYLLRQLHQDYDANLARARASRLSYGGRFDNNFPPVEPTPTYSAGYNGSAKATSTAEPNGKQQAEREPVPAWSRPNQIQRQMVRTRFLFSQHAGIVTTILIVANIIVFLLSMAFPEIVNWGIQDNALVMSGEYWRILTAMFLHASIMHIALNMFSLYFVGRAVEVLYGSGRYLLIYFVSGIAGGLLYIVTAGPLGAPAVGASGAIFGIFGALGAFYFANRQALSGTGAIYNWLFWMGLNLVFGFLPGSGIAVMAHIGGLIAGMVLAYLMLPRLGRKRS